MKELTEIRHYLHKHPEISGWERNTQSYLLALLSKLGPDAVQLVAETGILVTFNGQAPGRNLLIRGDMDALPIEETITTAYRSEKEGVSHKCGHDGHTTILYGLAQHFSRQRPDGGNVYLLFQPGEENGTGARGVVDSGVLQDLQIDMVFALHNLPGYDLHKIVCRTGSFTSSVVSIAADFKGYTAHAAEPWNGRNPGRAMSRYLIEALKHDFEDKGKHEYVTVTPVYSLLGSKSYGISAGEGTVHLTIRADTPEKMKAAIKAIEASGVAIAADEDLSVSYSYIEPFEANQNAAAAVNLIKKSAADLGLEYEDRPEPFRWGEDFGLFTGLYPGAMFGVGSGKDCWPLHHPAYDFPDDITATGINMFVQLQKNAQEL